jgi:uncharacterized membrane protein (UPF0127 family)
VNPRLVGALLAGLLVVTAGAVGLGVVDFDDPADDQPTVTIRDETGTAADGNGQSTPTGGDANQSTVTIRDDDAELATVRVRVADSAIERYQGLSGTDPLDDGEGMLFVHGSEDSYSYVMRDMNYPLDIVFVSAEGEITTIHHAELPPEGTPNRNLTRYAGRGKYVLEVPYGYTDRVGVEVGDRVVVPEQYR